MSFLSRLDQDPLRLELSQLLKRCVEAEEFLRKSGGIRCRPLQAMLNHLA
jgi:hypothetical protein